MTTDDLSTSTEAQGINLHPYLSLAASSKRLATLLSSLPRPFHPSTTTSPSASTTTTTTKESTLTEPETKSYPNIVYQNHHSLGISLSFQPRPSSSSSKTIPNKRIDQIEWDQLYLTAIDVYNHEARLEEPDSKSKKGAKKEYRPFPSYPISISIPANSTTSSSTTPLNANPKSSPTEFFIYPSTLAHEFTESLGEPSRKGGGSTTSIGIWCEWIELGLMVEFASSGLGAWEKGKDSVWSVLTIFNRGEEAGKEEGE